MALLLFTRIILINFVLVWSLEKKECPTCILPEYVSFGRKNYYIESISQLNWMGAIEYCNYLGMRLLTIESTDEWHFLSRFLATPGYRNDYWTAGNNIHKNTEHRWVTTGEILLNHNSPDINQYDLIISDKININDRTSLFMNSLENFKLTQAKWSDEKYFICEKISSETC